MKENVDDNLYYVEKLLRIEKVNDQLFVAVKWENWSPKHFTLEPIASIKLNPHLVQDLEKLLIQYHSRPIKHKLEQQTNTFTEDYLNLIFKDKPEKPEKTAQKGNSGQKTKKRKSNDKSQSKIQLQQSKNDKSKQKNQLFTQQIATCNFKARSLVSQRIKYGLANLRPSNYFQLKQILSSITQKIAKTHPKNLPVTDHAVEQVKGVSYKDQSYQFYVCVKGKVIVVPLNQMITMFPRSLYQFLTKFLKYMRQKMNDEIQKETDIIISRRHKAKTIETVSKFLNIREHFQNKKKQIFFGKNPEDVQQNIRLNRERFLGTGNNQEKQVQISHPSRKGLSKKTSQPEKTPLKKDIHTNDPSSKLKNLFTEIQNEINYTLRQCQSSEQMRSHRSKSVKSSRAQIKEASSANRKSSKNIQQQESEMICSFGQQLPSKPISIRSRSSKINQSFPPEIPQRKSQRIISRSNTIKSHSIEQLSRGSGSKDSQYKIKKKKNKNLKRKPETSKKQKSGGKKKFKKN